MGYGIRIELYMDVDFFKFPFYYPLTENVDINIYMRLDFKHCKHLFIRKMLIFNCINHQYKKYAFKALFTHNILTHNIAIKRYCNKKIQRHFLSKYCCYIPKSSQINRNKHFRFTQWKKNIGWKMSFYLFISIYFYPFIAILCAKMSSVNKA